MSEYFKLYLKFFKLCFHAHALSLLLELSGFDELECGPFLTAGRFRRQTTIEKL